MASDESGDPGEVDPVRTFSAAEKKRLTEQLLELTRNAHSGAYSAEPLSSALVCKLHRSLFAGVRDHAGKLRSRGWGQEHLSFGPNRSAHRNDVPREVERLCEKGELSLRSLFSSSQAHDYEFEALKVALKWHADFIRIHPFEDGNGRTARLLLGILLVRLGIRPIAIEVPRREYLDALNEYFQKMDMDVLLDLYLGLVGTE